MKKEKSGAWVKDFIVSLQGFYCYLPFVLETGLSKLAHLWLNFFTDVWDTPGSALHERGQRICAERAV